MLTSFRIFFCVLALLLAVPAFAQEDLAQAEEQLMGLVNEAREAEGVPRLEFEPRLRESARQHSERMAAEGRLSHQFDGERSPMERMADTGLHFDASAENVAGAETVEELHEALMNSPGHRKNILNSRYNAIGIGIRRSGEWLYATQNFAHRLADVEVSQAEKTILSGIESLVRTRTRDLRARASDELRGIACSMADDDNISAQRALDSVAGARSVTTFTTNDPADLPDQLKRAVREVTFSNVGVGACFRRTERYPAGIYWVVAVLYR